MSQLIPKKFQRLHSPNISMVIVQMLPDVTGSQDDGRQTGSPYISGGSL
jgi:hypothetical protein